jgi:hypothetical protein
MRAIWPLSFVLLFSLAVAGCTRFQAQPASCANGDCGDAPDFSGTDPSGELPTDLSVDSSPDAEPGLDIPVPDVPNDMSDIDVFETSGDSTTDPSSDPANDIEDTVHVQDVMDVADATPDIRDDVQLPDLTDVGSDVNHDIHDATAADIPLVAVGGTCLNDADCVGGACLPWIANDPESAKVCIGPCDGGCPAGLQCLASGDAGVAMCMPIPGGLCAACQVPSDCPTAGSQCLDMPGGGRYCSTPCPTGSCLIGFTCTLLDIQGLPEDQKNQCLPNLGDCACTAELKDMAFPCEISNQSGTCNGVRLCNASGQWSACSSRVPSVERCNKEDDDCDGPTDEGFAYHGLGMGAECVGDGQCTAGRVQCSIDGSRATCSTNFDGAESQAIPETCDGLDNDCDGQTDNGMLYAGLPVGALCLGAGTCGPGTVECNMPSGLAVCSSNPDGSSPQAQPEICDGLDNDCDGHVDNGVKASSFDCLRKGICAGKTVPASCVRGAWVCNYSGIPGFEVAETLCDGIDSDCDGVVDGQFPFGEACDGLDTDRCKNGIFECSANGRGVTCGVETVTDIRETCNGKDDDCDDMIDEDFPARELCDGLDTDSCLQGTYTCTADGLGVECVNEPDPPSPPTIELCDGLDNDCNGVTDDPFTDLGLACDIDPVSPIPCKTGTLGCSESKTELACVGHVDCAANSTCNVSGVSTVADSCVCGTPSVACTADIASECTVDGICQCGIGAACTGTAKCVFVETEYICQ